MMTPGLKEHLHLVLSTFSSVPWWKVTVLHYRHCSRFILVIERVAPEALGALVDVLHCSGNTYKVEIWNDTRGRLHISYYVIDII